jgi:nucleolar pre-ribosomal-associated protein 2
MMAAKTLHLLLDQKAACMTQWNIDLTLSTVSALCAETAAQQTSLAVSSPRIYHWLCRLVEIVIKRHRKRLEGHFPILITVLQSLLRRLLSQPHHDDDPAQQEKHARLFTRLLTLICEPAVASVSRSQAANSLDSEKDKAKRYAGQFMYLVLLEYVKLQIRHVVPHHVREVLETGMFSIMDITTPDGLKIANDAMDPSGRVIFRELHKQYQKFGKWSGV